MYCQAPGSSPSEGYAGHRQQFAHLLKTDRIPSPARFRGHRNARSTICALLCIASSMPRVWNSVELTLASAGAVGYATDGAASSVARSWSALWIAGSGAYPPSPPRRSASRPAPGANPVAYGPLSRGWSARPRPPDHHVRVFAARQTVRDRLRRFSHRRAGITTRVVAGLFFPRRGQLPAPL